jgi:putative acetyltransferase
VDLVTAPSRRRPSYRLGMIEETAAQNTRRDSVRIVVDDLSGPEIAELLEEHLEQMRAITPLESKHALDLDELRGPEVTFWSALDGDVPVGCAAIKRLDATHAEVKSMRTRPNRTRGGIASMLLAHLIDEARRMGFTRLSLETGSAEFFLPARTLYQKFGFDYCEPFADYRLDPHSVYMTRLI